MKETIEHNNRFYGEELKTESEQLKEWLVIANKEIERLTTELDKTRLSELDKEYRINKAIEWVENHKCRFTNDDGELVISEVSLVINARPNELLEILKGEVNE